MNKIIHFNRDENSFTARFFERLIYQFEKTNSEFIRFINTVKEKANSNRIFLKNYSLTEIPELKLKYEDGIEFLENIDLYSYCKSNGIEVEIDEENIDKTEFDFVITAVNEDGKSVFLIFEIKCFSDLDRYEIERQNCFLQKYKGRIFYDFYHFALISYENFERGSIPKETFNNTVNFSIISWEDVKCFLDEKRFIKNIEFGGLFRTIHLNGRGENKRYLIKPDNL